MEESNVVKHVKSILFILLLLLPFTSVKAECSSTEVSKLRKIANNVNVSYVFYESRNATYDVTISNLTTEIYLMEALTNKKYSYNSKNKDVVISNVKAGTVLKLEIYATKKNCYDDKLTSKTVVLPTYNLYYKDPLCEQAKDHPLCQRFTKTGITEDEFRKIINDYLKPDEQEQEVPTNNLWLDLLLDYYWVLLSIIIVGGTTGIIVYRNKNKLF